MGSIKRCEQSDEQLRWWDRSDVESSVCWVHHGPVGCISRWERIAAVGNKHAFTVYIIYVYIHMKWIKRIDCIFMCKFNCVLYGLIVLTPFRLMVFVGVNNAAQDKRYCRFLSIAVWFGCCLTPHEALERVEEMCKEVYKNLGADSSFLVQLFQQFGFRFTAELLLMLQSHFCCYLRSAHELFAQLLSNFWTNSHWT